MAVPRKQGRPDHAPRSAQLITSVWPGASRLSEQATLEGAAYHHPARMKQGRPGLSMLRAARAPALLTNPAAVCYTWGLAMSCGTSCCLTLGLHDALPAHLPLPPPLHRSHPCLISTVVRLALESMPTLWRTGPPS